MSAAIPVGNIAVGTCPPRSWSTFVWASIAALSVTASYLITLLLGIASISFGLLIVREMVRAGPSTLTLILTPFLFLIGFSILCSLLPGKDRFEVRGVPIDLFREPQLRAEIEVLAKALAERVPDEIYLVFNANAGVVERRRKRIMLIGLPLLASLTVSQFRAILAHELAHYYAGDALISPWVFRARLKMAQVVERLGRDSGLLSFLSTLAVVAVLRLIILGGLSLWWHLFNRLTRYISREQEYRCDELACHLVGSGSLEEGLCSVVSAAATFARYWEQVVKPLAHVGYLPPLADGYGRFLRVPAIETAASGFLAKQLATTSTTHTDSHPPLNARIQRARTLAIGSVCRDDRSAVSLFNDLAGLEAALLAKELPDLKHSKLRTMHWDRAGLEVYVPVWRGEVAKLSPALGSATLSTLPDKVARLAELASNIPNPPGRLLTRDQRTSYAAEGLAKALTLALLDHGWQLHLQPGYFYVESDNGAKLFPNRIVKGLRDNAPEAEQWVQYCRECGMADWPLIASF